MNNRFKFRAWDKVENKWLYGYETLGGFSLIGETILMGEFGAYSLQKLCEEIHITQWTGLKDKNGKEIYEGDVVKFHYFYESLGENLGVQESEHELIGVIEWGNYGWCVSAIKGEYWSGYTGYLDGEGTSSVMELYLMNQSGLHEESFEVIGNKFENPEML